mgnify:CR=1 FL=1
MIKVVIPNNFLPEREYIVETIISELLGIDYIIQIDETTENYTLILPNENKLIISNTISKLIKL